LILQELHDADRGLDRGSRPVGEQVRGWPTNARAIETPLPPPESWSGYGPCPQANQAQDLGDLVPDVAPAAAGHLKRVRDVVVDAAVGEQLEVLEHGADAPAQMGKAAGRQAVDVPARDSHLAAGRLHLADQHLDQRRLAAAGGPDDERELTPPKREGDALDPHVAAR
jgi:hypothetical protein